MRAEAVVSYYELVVGLTRRARDAFGIVGG